MSSGIPNFPTQFKTSRFDSVTAWTLLQLYTPEYTSDFSTVFIYKSNATTVDCTNVWLSEVLKRQSKHTKWSLVEPSVIDSL